MGKRRQVSFTNLHVKGFTNFLLHAIIFFSSWKIEGKIKVQEVNSSAQTSRWIQRYFVLSVYPCQNNVLTYQIILSERKQVVGRRRKKQSLGYRKTGTWMYILRTSPHHHQPHATHILGGSMAWKRTGLVADGTTESPEKRFLGSIGSPEAADSWESEEAV